MHAVENCPQAKGHGLNVLHSVERVVDVDKTMADSAPKVCDYLVVDSGGFLKNAPLREMAEKEVITIRDVVDEIRDKATKQRLQVLPYEIVFKSPDQDDIKQGRNGQIPYILDKYAVPCNMIPNCSPSIFCTVTEFSKSTGDYASLSATDMKVRLNLTP